MTERLGDDVARLSGPKLVTLGDEEPPVLLIGNGSSGWREALNGVECESKVFAQFGDVTL